MRDSCPVRVVGSLGSVVVVTSVLGLVRLDLVVASESGAGLGDVTDTPSAMRSATKCASEKRGASSVAKAWQEVVGSSKLWLANNESNCQ